MNGWWIVLACLAVLALCVGLAMWGRKSAYQREAEEYGDDNGTNP